MDAAERRKHASEAAAQWWVRLQPGPASPSEREQFVDWLRESPVHVAEMIRVSRVHNALEQFQHWARIDANGSAADSNVVALRDLADGAIAEVEPRFWKKTGTLALAAGLLLMVLVGGWLMLLSRGQVITTAQGERSEVSLADGSVLQVDPRTRLRVKFQEHERRVFLERGRALFRVAKNSRRPFFVESDGTVVRAIGTAFGVERNGGDTVVTVAEGKVSVMEREPTPGRWQEATSSHEREGPLVVAAPTRSSSAVGAEREGGSVVPSRHGGRGVGSLSLESDTGRQPGTGEVFLGANQQLTIAGSGSVGPVRAVDSKRELAWAEGRLVFDNVAVADVIAQFNRYNRVQLRVIDDALARRPVSAVFDASDPESFIDFIESVAPVVATRRDDRDITLSVKARARTE